MNGRRTRRSRKEDVEEASEEAPLEMRPRDRRRKGFGLEVFRQLSQAEKSLRLNPKTGSHDDSIFGEQGSLMVVLPYQALAAPLEAVVDWGRGGYCKSC